MTTTNRSFVSSKAIAGIAALATVSFFAAGRPAFAGYEAGYWHESYSLAPNVNWMSKLPDSMRLSHMSIPGTHDTMAQYLGFEVQTQSMDLYTQLFSGVRVLDIRIMFEFNTFGLSHGAVPLPGNFDHVMQTVGGFLQAFPSETVLMRISDEENGLGNTIGFEDAFKTYWSTYSNVFWHPSGDTNPKLGDLRGKVVVLQHFSATGTYGLSYNNFNLQDNYTLSSNWDLYSKWSSVKNQLIAANQYTGNESTMYMNYLSGSSGAAPYFVASGKVAPDTNSNLLSTGETTPAFNNYPDFPRTACVGSVCTISFEGTNGLTYSWLTASQRTRVGIIMADFPGPELINAIIALNQQTKN